MCSKIKYKNFQHATQRMKFLNNRKGLNLRRAYHCEDCGHFHLTSMHLIDFLLK